MFYKMEKQKYTDSLSLKFIIVILCLTFSHISFAQDSTSLANEVPGNIVIVKDTRIDLLGRKLADYNSRQAYKHSRTGPGYRLMVMSTSNREEAIKVRTYLLQQYPDQQIYMTFVNPFIKLKFGDFADRKEAEDVRKQLERSPLITGNIYIVPETVNLKGDKSLLEN